MSVLSDKSSNMENVCDEEKKLFAKLYVLTHIFVNDMFLWLFCCCFICCFFFLVVVVTIKVNYSIYVSQCLGNTTILINIQKSVNF